MLGAALTAAPKVAAESAGFPEGVAAQATATTATIWTRAATAGEIGYELNAAPDFSGDGESGTLTASAARDNTARVKLLSLSPSTTYYYRFTAGDTTSDVGRFETLAAADMPTSLTLSFTGDSDSLWTQDPQPQGQPFEVLARIAEENPDLFIYMGDTIYSDSETEAPLARTRAEKWAKYRANRVAAAQALLKQTNTWAVWDDHEVVNDFDGAVLSGTDPALLKAGRQAFNDYWPVDPKRHYRKVAYGSDVDLFFLDERTYRTKSVDETKKCRDADGDLDFAPTMPQGDRAFLGFGPVAPKCLKAINNPAASMLGEKQLAWLETGLKSSTATWKLIVNEVPMTQIFVLPYDRWEGFGHERSHLLSFIQRNVSNVVFLTTDIHANFGARVYKDIAAEGATPAAYEVVTGPIQTCTLDCEINRIAGEGSGEKFKNFLQFQGLVDTDCIEINRYGYSMLRVTASSLAVEWKGNEAAESGVGGTPICDPVTLPAAP
jgi:alkaline phosphatase D